MIFEDLICEANNHIKTLELGSQVGLFYLLQQKRHKKPNPVLWSKVLLCKEHKLGTFTESLIHSFSAFYIAQSGSGPSSGHTESTSPLSLNLELRETDSRKLQWETAERHEIPRKDCLIQMPVSGHTSRRKQHVGWDKGVCWEEWRMGMGARIWVDWLCSKWRESV